MCVPVLDVEDRLVCVVVVICILKGIQREHRDMVATFHNKDHYRSSPTPSVINAQNATFIGSAVVCLPLI